MGKYNINLQPLLATVKGLEKNDPNLRKNILGKSINAIYILILFYFKAIKHVINNPSVHS
jgi:hypothetical protein